MLKAVDSFLAHRSKLSILLISVAMTIGIGGLDFMTGYDLSLGLFYVVPIGLASWYISRPAGIIEALLCATTWFVANALTAPGYIVQALLLWNTAIRFGFFLIIAVLLISLREAYGREKASARTDPLTGVANSRAFYESAELELIRARRVGYPLTLLYLDIDNFKGINDTHGHGAGDALLMSIGHVLKKSLRATDFVARLGGDEFAVLLPDTNDEQASLVISKIQEAISLETRAWNLGISASVGAATASDLPGNIDELVRAADAAMYQNKALKRSQNLQPKWTGDA